MRRATARILVPLLVLLPLAAVRASGASEYTPIATIRFPASASEEMLYCVRAVEGKDGFGYVLTRDGELYTYDLRDLSERTPAAEYRQWQSKIQLEATGGLVRNRDYLYAVGSYGLEIVDVRDPAAPLLVGALADKPQPARSAVLDGNLLVTSGYWGVTLYDVQSPSRPQLLSQIVLGNDVNWSAAAVSGDVLYVSSGSTQDPRSARIRRFDIFDPANPVELREFSSEPRELAYHLFAVDGYLVEVADSSVDVWDIAYRTVTSSFDLEEPVAGRVAALVGGDLILNGLVLETREGQIGVSSRFVVDDYCIDGSPYGGAVRDGFVFLARSGSILVLCTEETSRDAGLLGNVGSSAPQKEEDTQPPVAWEPLAEWAATAPSGSLHDADICRIGSDRIGICSVDGDILRVLCMRLNGDVIWERGFFGAGPSSRIEASGDGGVVVASDATQFGPGSRDPWILRFSRDGELLWHLAVGGPGEDWGKDLLVDDGNSVVVVGSTNYPTQGILLFKVDPDGQLQWSKVYEGTGNDYGYGVAAVPGGGYLISGATDSYGAGKLDAALLSVDSSGNIRWSKTYGGPLNDAAREVVIGSESSADFSIEACGTTDWQGGIGKGDTCDGLFVRVSPDGQLLTQLKLDGPGYDVLQSLSSSGDGKTLVAGSSTSHDPQGRTPRGWVAALGESAGAEWNRTAILATPTPKTRDAPDDSLEFRRILALSGTQFVAIGTADRSGSESLVVILGTAPLASHSCGELLLEDALAVSVPSNLSVSDAPYVVHTATMDHATIAREWLMEARPLEWTICP